MELKSYLMQLTAFAGLFFASAPVVIDGGGADPGGGAGADPNVGDTGAEEGAIDGAEDAEIPDESAQEVPDGEQPTDKQVDGRNAPDALKKALNKIREADPEASKTIRSAFFKQDQELRGYKDAFQSPAEAAEIRDVIESFGGTEGLSQLKTEADAYSSELAAMAKGDPSVIENLSRDFPKALPKLIGAGLAKLQSLDPVAYQRAQAGMVSQVFRDQGVSTSIDRLMYIIENGGEQAPARAYAIVKQLREWADGVDHFAKAPPPKDETQDQEFQQREQQVSQKEAAIRNREISSEVTKGMNSIIQTHLNSLLKGRNLTMTQKQDLAKGAYDSISESLKANKGYQDRLKALLKTGDVQRVSRYVAAEVSKIAKRSVDGVWNNRGFASSKPKPAANGSAAAPSGVRALPKKPSIDTLDMTKDPRKELYMQGMGFDKKTGQKVKWDWEAN